MGFHIMSTNDLLLRILPSDPQRTGECVWYRFANSLVHHEWPLCLLLEIQISYGVVSPL